MQNVYLTYRYVSNGDYLKELNTLPSIVIEHCNAYKTDEKRLESIYAWQTLNDLIIKVTGKGLNEYSVTFSSNGKPLIDGYYIGLSHSNGIVAVACSDTDFGLDVETVQDANKFKAVATKLNVPLNDDLFLKWTEVESVTKLNDKYTLTLSPNQFLTSYYINVNGKKVALSVASNNKFNLITI